MKTQSVMRTCSSLVVLAALMITAGCDRQKSGKAEHTQKQGVQKVPFDPKNPCTLLKKEEAEALLKLELQDLVAHDGSCLYGPQEPSPKFTSLYIDVATLDEPDPSKVLKDTMKLLQEDASKLGQVIKQVDGIGDGAFFQLDPRQNDKQLFTIKGKYWVRFIMAKGDLSEDAIKTLAKTVLDRIP